MIINNIRWSRKKTKEHGLEHVILNDDESELWESDYDAGHAANVSEYVQLDLLKHDSIVKYSGRIKDFLSEQRCCKNIDFLFTNISLYKSPEKRPLTSIFDSYCPKA